MATEMVTVLFTDLVGSTALMARVGPERAEALRVEHFSLLRAAVAEHEGREVKNLGDGLMVVFGAVSRALDAGVAMQQAFEARNRSADEPMVVRIGLSTGEADVADGDYFGVPVVEAARLCAATGGGEVLASDLVRMMAGGRGGHRFESVGSLELKGLEGPVAACRVGWEPLSANDVTGAGLPARLKSAAGLFVGRTAERGVLDAALKSVKAGDGRRVVLVGGEPGIGKTTLVSEFAAGVHAAGAVVAYGRCDEDLSIPYQPWREAIGHLVDAGLVEAAPLGALVGTVGRAGGTSDQEAERYQLFRAVTDALSSVAAEHPVVVVLDDLHWADAPTASLLRHVATTVGEARLVVIVTYRDAEISSGHPMADVLAQLHREPGIDRILLRGLGDLDVLALLETLAGHTLDDDADGMALRDALLAETDGNPFFTVEILRHLAETGAITQDVTGRWVATTDLAAHGLPTSVRDVTGQRVARLGPEVQRVLRLASVIGRDFDLGVLAEVADLDEERLLDLLEPAEATALIAEIAPARFTFGHALVEHTLYEELSGTRRSRAHHAVAEAIEARATGDSGARAGELAHHWASATSPTDTTKAVDYARQAGDYALATLAPEEAARWYQRALDLLTDQPGDREALRTRAQLLADLGTAQRDQGDPGYRTTLLDAANLACDTGDTDTLVRAAVATHHGWVTNAGHLDVDLVDLLQRALAATDGEQTTRRAQLLATLALAIITDDPDQALDRARQAMALVTTVGDDDVITWTATRASNAAQRPDTLDERLEWGRIAQEAAVRSGDPLTLHNATRPLFAWLEVAKLDEYDRVLEQRKALSHQLGHPALIWGLSTYLVGRQMIAGELDTAERLLGESVQMGLAIGAPDAMLRYGGTLFLLRDMQGRFPEMLDLIADAARDFPNIASLRAGHALCLLRAGRPDAARDIVGADLADGFTSVPFDWLWTAAMAVFADVVAALRIREGAQPLYDLIAPYADQIPTTHTNTYEVFHFALGRLAAVLGRSDEAEAHLARAHEIHAAMPAPYFLARTQVAWADLLLTRGDPADHERTHQLATQARDEAATRGFALVETDARGLLARLDG